MNSSHNNLAIEKSKEKYTSNKNTALHIAAHQGNMDLIDRLIKDDVHINASNEVNVTPLYLAAQNGHVENYQKITKMECSLQQCWHDGK